MSKFIFFLLFLGSLGNVGLTYMIVQDGNAPWPAMFALFCMLSSAVYNVWATFIKAFKVTGVYDAHTKSSK